MTTSEQIHEIAAACAKAQAALRPALKDATNPAFKSKYADLASMMEAAKVYAQQGIAVWQDATSTAEGVSVVTRLAHSSGQWIECGPFTVPTGKKDAHGIGSAATYAKRYALAAALGIASDDDDGTGATQSAPAPATSQSAPVPVPKQFTDWLTDLEAVADEGEPALKLAWESSPKDLRAFLTSTFPQKWEAIKAKSKRVPVSA